MAKPYLEGEPNHVDGWFANAVGHLRSIWASTGHDGQGNRITLVKMGGCDKGESYMLAASAGNSSLRQGGRDECCFRSVVESLF